MNPMPMEFLLDALEQSFPGSFSAKDFWFLQVGDCKDEHARCKFGRIERW